MWGIKRNTFLPNHLVSFIKVKYYSFNGIDWCCITIFFHIIVVRVVMWLCTGEQIFIICNCWSRSILFVTHGWLFDHDIIHLSPKLVGTIDEFCAVIIEIKFNTFSDLSYLSWIVPNSIHTLASKLEVTRWIDLKIEIRVEVSPLWEFMIVRSKSWDIKGHIPSTITFWTLYWERRFIWLTSTLYFVWSMWDIQRV